MKKVVLIVLGVIAALAGLALAIGGIALTALFGPDGTYDAPRERLDTPTHALVSEPVELENDAPVGSGFGGVKVRLGARSNERDAIFVGIGRARDVDAYLRGAAVDVITEWSWDDGDAITKERIDGEATPDAPGDQDFWEVRSVGVGDQRVTWKLRNGTHRLVVMNADASPGVDVAAKWGVEIPWIFPLGIGLLVAALLALILAVVLIVFGVRARTAPVVTAPPVAGAWSSPGAAPAPWGPPPTSAPTPPPPAPPPPPPPESPDAPAQGDEV
jgi:hypothetical protein